jgi:C_GCAxxG_C_C family probable redox protein
MINEIEKIKIKDIVHTQYYSNDNNCAITTLICLGKLLDLELSQQIVSAATGLHGAGGYRAQCGLVEGGLMIIGILGNKYGLSKDEVAKICYEFAEGFEKKFASLRCLELRPGGFRKNDPPHLCENLTVNACIFSYEFIHNIFGKSSMIRSCGIPTDDI